MLTHTTHTHNHTHIHTYTHTHTHHTTHTHTHTHTHKHTHTQTHTNSLSLTLSHTHVLVLYMAHGFRQLSQCAHLCSERACDWKRLGYSPRWSKQKMKCHFFEVLFVYSHVMSGMDVLTQFNKHAEYDDPNIVRNPHRIMI
jgi:hypothetical protein